MTHKIPAADHSRKQSKFFSLLYVIIIIPNCTGSLSCLFSSCYVQISCLGIALLRCGAGKKIFVPPFISCDANRQIIQSDPAFISSKDSLVFFVLFKLLSPWSKCKSYSLTRVDLKNSLLVMNF